MAKFARRQEEANPVFWLATGARKMDPSYPLGISLVCSAKATSLLLLLGHIINPLTSNFVRLVFSDIGLVPFCEPRPNIQPS